MSFFEGLFGAEGSQDAARTYAEAAKMWDELPELSPEEVAKRGKSLYESGMISPEEYTAMVQGKSSLESYAGDPRLREAQMRSLDYLTNVGTQGGMTAQDRAQLNEIQNRNMVAARGARDANAQRMASRGMGGSGMEAVQNMIGDQGAATANYLGGTEVAANAERRALEAMTNAGNLGGQIRGQEFSEAEKKAAAADAINRFNVANQNAAAQSNVMARNQSREEARRMQEEAIERKRQKIAGKTATYVGQAPYQERAGQQMGEAVGGMASIIPSMIAGGMMSDERMKEDIAPAEPDIEEFLSKLKPQKWEYKEPEKYGEGTKYGVMAQDMEKSPVGKQFVSEDAEGVKRIDYGAAQSTMLAILKSLSDRMDRLDKEENGRG